MTHIQYVEYDAEHKGDHAYDFANDDTWAILFTHTSALFLINGAYAEYPPNCMILYRPHQRVCYKANENSYSNDWIRFQTDEVYVTQTTIPCGVPFTITEPRYIHKLFQLLTYEHEKKTEANQMILDGLLHILFIKMTDANIGKKAYTVYSNLQELRSEIYARVDKKWTVRHMAAMLNISIGHLENIYKDTYGVSCIDDVINSRIAQAKKMLINSHWSIKEIGNMCGYNSSEHFLRQFKKRVGLTPKQYRAIRSE